MICRRLNLCRRIHGAKAVRREIANQTKKEWVSASDRNEQRMVQICAEETSERRSARL